MTAFFAYLCQFLAGENVQIASDVAGTYWQPWVMMVM